MYASVSPHPHHFFPRKSKPAKGGPFNYFSLGCTLPTCGTDSKTELKTFKAGQDNPPEAMMKLGWRRLEMSVKLRLWQAEQKVGAQAARIANLVVGRF